MLLGRSCCDCYDCGTLQASVSDGVGFRLNRGGILHGEPGAELHPSRTQLHIRIAVEAARLDAKVGYTSNRKLQGLRDTKVHVSPIRIRVAAYNQSACVNPIDNRSSLTPVASKVSTPSKSTSGHEPRSLAAVGLDKRVVSGIGAKMAV